MQEKKNIIQQKIKKLGVSKAKISCSRSCGLRGHVNFERSENEKFRENVLARSFKAQIKCFKAKPFFEN